MYHPLVFLQKINFHILVPLTNNSLELYPSLPSTRLLEISSIGLKSVVVLSLIDVERLLGFRAPVAVVLGGLFHAPGWGTTGLTILSIESLRKYF